MDHAFGTPAYNIGIEEELMVLDASSLDLASGAEHLVEEVDAGAIKHELHESVIEISTQPCADVREAEAQLRALRTRVRERAAEHDLGIAAAGTHPFARWEDQRISPAERYRQLVGYADWADWTARMTALVDAGVIEDHTWLWYDVRVHPGFGTVEVRSMDSQTRVEHTVALAALVQALVRSLAEDGTAAPDVSHELLDENRWLAARAGLTGELVKASAG